MPQCRLCMKEKELRVSHIIPSFVFKWLKETSATGHIRFGQEPNQRIQDGYKIPFLCEDCETTLNEWETQFANTVFHPYTGDRTIRARYADWMLKFCVSISWRVLAMMKEKEGLDHFSQEQAACADNALLTWKQFLDGDIPHPGPYEQHLLPLDAIKSFKGVTLPANINRYLLRTVDIDTVVGERTGFVYSKFGPFVLVGFIYAKTQNEWRGTKIHVRHGEFSPRDYQLPAGFFDYLVGQANKFAMLHEKLSDRQREKIDSAARSNIDRVAKSASFEAMCHDVEMFGGEAFEVHNGKKK